VRRENQESENTGLLDQEDNVCLSIEALSFHHSRTLVFALRWVFLDRSLDGKFHTFHSISTTVYQSKVWMMHGGMGAGTTMSRIPSIAL